MSKPEYKSAEWDHYYRTGQTNERGQVICGAPRPKSDLPCQSVFINPRNGRCNKHGGKTLIGEAHPNYKNGNASRYGPLLPERLRPLLNQMAEDQDRLDLSDEIDLSRTRLAELLTRLEQGLSLDIVKTLRKSWSKMQTAMRNEDKKALGEAMTDHSNALRALSNDYGAWADYDRWLARLQNLTESQRRYEIERSYVIPIEQVELIFTRMRLRLQSEIFAPTFKELTPRQLMSRLAEEIAIVEGVIVREGNDESV